jgi:hypothetical protein
LSWKKFARNQAGSAEFAGITGISPGIIQKLRKAFVPGNSGFGLTNIKKSSGKAKISAKRPLWLAAELGTTVGGSRFITHDASQNSDP